jgi:hypothetical protein
MSQSDEARNKPITHSGHYAEIYSNQDLRLFIASDDIDEPPNFDSVSTITDQNLKVEFFKNYCIVKDRLDHFQTIATGIRE